MDALPPLTQTFVVAGLITAVMTLLGLIALWWELRSMKREATFSRAFWEVWARQPWVVLLVWTLLVFTTGFLMGHFTAQSATVYEAIRKGAM